MAALAALPDRGLAAGNRPGLHRSRQPIRRADIGTGLSFSRSLKRAAPAAPRAAAGQIKKDQGHGTAMPAPGLPGPASGRLAPGLSAQPGRRSMQGSRPGAVPPSAIEGKAARQGVRGPGPGRAWTGKPPSASANCPVCSACMPERGPGGAASVISGIQPGAGVPPPEEAVLHRWQKRGYSSSSFSRMRVWFFFAR